MTRLIRRQWMDGSGLESSYKGKDQGDMLNIVQVERGKSVEINS